MKNYQAYPDRAEHAGGRLRAGVVREMLSRWITPGGVPRGRSARLVPLNTVCWIVLVAGSLAGMAGCSPSESRPRSRNHRVEIHGFEYEPPALIVAVGDTVTWVNGDLVSHTATSVGGGWDTGQIAAGDSLSLVATASGGEYTCTYHPTMRGRLEIE